MKSVYGNQKLNQPLIQQLVTTLKGELTKSKGEYHLKFNNRDGKGHICEYAIGETYKLLNFDLYFLEDTVLTLNPIPQYPVNFLYIEKGDIKFISNCQKENIQTFNQFQNIITVNHPHRDYSFVVPAKKNVKFNLVQVSFNEFLSKNTVTIDSISPEMRTIFSPSKGELPFVHIGNYSLRINDILSEQEELPKSDVVRFLKLEGLINLTLAEHLSEYQEYNSKPFRPELIMSEVLINLKSVTDDIENNLHEFRSIADLCKKHGFSQPKLQDMFKTFYGKTINEYMKDRKMEVAKDLIEHTYLSISEVVYKIGYKSHSYFSKLFFERYGMLPTEFRDKFKKKNKSA